MRLKEIPSRDLRLRDNVSNRVNFVRDLRLKHNVSNGVKVGILSLGCARNIIDSEIILGRLNLKKFQIVDIGDADIAIINTCAFLQEACEESVDKILDLIHLKKQGSLRKIIVAGCLPARYKSQLAASLPEIDAFLAPPMLSQGPQPRMRLTPAHYSYLKICEGCLNDCSFCIIPKIKGRFISRTLESIAKEVECLDTPRMREINIIGQDISQYGLDLYKRSSLDKLLRRIRVGLKHIRWIRLLYLHPAHVTKSLIRLIAQEPLICKYIDLPLQHINQRILKQMNRNSFKKDIINLIHYIRKTIPDVAIRTSFIVGFPGETEREFKELLGFIKELRFERLGAFLYSREENTPAYKFERQIPEIIKQQRFDELMRLQQSVAEDICKQSIGKQIEVLIEEKCTDSIDSYLGRTSHDAPEVDGLCYVRGRNLKIGEIVSVKIRDNLEYDLIGEAL